MCVNQEHGDELQEALCIHHIGNMDAIYMNHYDAMEIWISYMNYYWKCGSEIQTELCAFLRNMEGSYKKHHVYGWKYRGELQEAL